VGTILLPAVPRGRLLTGNDPFALINSFPQHRQVAAELHG
jgi:hypothetical protein